MARNLRTSLISGGFGTVPGVRAAITPFGSAPITSPVPSIVPPNPNVFSNTASTTPPTPAASVTPSPNVASSVVNTGRPLPPNTPSFTFGNPFNESDFFRGSEFDTYRGGRGDIRGGQSGGTGEAGEGEGEGEGEGDY